MPVSEKANNYKRLIIAVVSIICILFIAVGTAWAEPKIISVSPAHLNQLDQVTEVTAFVYDATGDIRLSIDGNAVIATLTGDTVTYRQNFAPGLHKAYLVVTDSAGQQAERTWSFYVNDPAKPYLLPDEATCEKCHSSTFYVFPGHLIDQRIPGSHSYNCSACHYFKPGEPRLMTRADGSDQIVAPDGNICGACHTPHNARPGTPLFIWPTHSTTNWKGTWPSADAPIRAPRSNFDCQYCHQPGTKVRMGHDLVADHAVDDPACTSCHSGVLTVVHNKNGNTCNTCHESPDPVVQNVVKTPMVARAGIHSFQTGALMTGGKTVINQYYDELNLGTVSLTVYGPNSEAVSEAWSPGPGLEIKRLWVDNWKAADRQYILAYVEKENKWYNISVVDEGKKPYGRYPSTSMTRELYLPAGTTQIKTVIKTGAVVDSISGSGLSVTKAYYNKPVKCSDCHSGGSHETQHATTALDNKCTTCHINNLIGEHFNNPNTQAQTWNCDTCHKSTNPVVVGAIVTENKHCAACHRQGHNLLFAETTPVDIPLYSGFQWSVPSDAFMWAGESWIPDEFISGGKVVISNRRTDITGGDVWAFYQSEMAGNGWTLTSDAPAAGSEFFSVTFTKGTHKAIIWFYGGESHTASPVQAGGYRIEILYK